MECVKITGIPCNPTLVYVICSFDLILWLHVGSIWYIKDGMYLANFICIKETINNFGIITISSLQMHSSLVIKPNKCHDLRITSNPERFTVIVIRTYILQPHFKITKIVLILFFMPKGSHTLFKDNHQSWAVSTWRKSVLYPLDTTIQRNWKVIILISDLIRQIPHHNNKRCKCKCVQIYQNLLNPWL